MKFIIGKQTREVSVDGLTYKQFNDLDLVKNFKDNHDDNLDDHGYPYQVAPDTYNVSDTDYDAFIWPLKWYFQDAGLYSYKIVINGIKYKIEKKRNLYI